LNLSHRAQHQQKDTQGDRTTPQLRHWLTLVQDC
jgi:hypothetical protein